MFTRYDQIAEMLRSEDIEGLIEIGAPGDEYDSEAEMIAERVAAAEAESSTGKIARSQVLRIARDVWADMFDLDEADLQRRQQAFENVARLLSP